MSILSVLTVFGVTVATQTPLEFEVASIKRNTTGDLSNPAQTLPNGEIRVLNTPVRNLILRAYPLPSLPIQVLGLPGWAEIQGERYDVIARGKPGATAEEQQEMWRALFADRMKLSAHYETREQEGYNLVLARRDRALGPNLTPATVDCSEAAAQPPSMDGCRVFVSGDTIGTGSAPLADLVRMITLPAGRPITDRTGLTGRFAFRLTFQRFPSSAGRPGAPGDSPPLFTALEDQLGLKLESTPATVRVLVIDHIERPTDN